MNTNYPQSTYRLQFHAGFTFRDAAAIVPYLAKFGVSHVYASPYLKARAGSTHGYDVIDHCSLNPELGTQADYAAFCAALAEHGMSHILDIVPNHVGVATNDNNWWNDVLRHGRDSKYAEYFDIAWEGSPRPELHGKVLLPLLGDHYANVLEKGELKVTHDEQGFWVNYYDRRFPLTVPQSMHDDPPATLRQLNGTAGDAHSFDKLHELLDQQHYRLAYWKNASDEINYRRFFDVNDLAALRMEREDVFQDAHKLIFRLVREGKVTGLRLDHPDGLYNPAEYFQRLQHELSTNDKPFYLLAEKILESNETLPDTWPIHGTTGYEFLNFVNGLFVNPHTESTFTRIYQEFTGERRTFDEIIYEKKKLILETSLASELHMLAVRLDRLAQRHRAWRDFTLATLIRGLREIIACFSVYRTYIDGPEVVQCDQNAIRSAVHKAMKHNADMDPAFFQFIEDVLIQNYPPGFSEQDKAAQLEFAQRFQQLTSPATAKGVEDTAFYTYNRFISLNEVGGNPGQFGVSREQVHRFFAHRQSHWPYAMSTLSTHDTKRSEDVRARLNFLTNFSWEWEKAVNASSEAANRFRKALGPSRNEEYLLYQILVGMLPPDLNAIDDELVKRIQDYMVKAMREAKVNTSWTSPNELYESTVKDFIHDCLHSAEFLMAISTPAVVCHGSGVQNSFCQTLLKLTAPGIPDTYQGTELTDYSLVDPDNRRPVDFSLRQEKLNNILSDQDPGGEFEDNLKLEIHMRVLELRRKYPDLFTTGKYVRVEVTDDSERIFAFARKGSGRTALVAVTRIHYGLAMPLERGTVHFQTERPMRNVFKAHTLQPGATHRVHDVMQKQLFALYIDD